MPSSTTYHEGLLVLRAPRSHAAVVRRVPITGPLDERAFRLHADVTGA